MPDLPAEAINPTTRRAMNEETGEVFDPSGLHQELVTVYQQCQRQEKIITRFAEMLKEMEEQMSFTIDTNVKAKLTEIGEMRSEKIDELRLALTKCKVEMGCMIPDKTSKSNYGSKSASLEDIQYFASPFMQKHGLSIDFDAYELSKREYLKATLSHISGQFKANVLEVHIKAKGSYEKGNKKELEQGDIEAAYTYTKKRLFALMLGLHCGG